MTQALICLTVAIVFLALMPAMVRSSKRSRRGRSAGAGVGDVLLGAFDPAKKVAIEQIRKQRDIGDHERGAVGDKLE